MSPSSEPLISVMFDVPLKGTIAPEPTEKIARVKNFIAGLVEFR